METAASREQSTATRRSDPAHRQEGTAGREPFGGVRPWLPTRHPSCCRSPQPRALGWTARSGAEEQGTQAPTCWPLLPARLRLPTEAPVHGRGVNLSVSYAPLAPDPQPRELPDSPCSPGPPGSLCKKEVSSDESWGVV